MKLWRLFPILLVMLIFPSAHAVSDVPYNHPYTGATALCGGTGGANDWVLINSQYPTSQDVSAGVSDTDFTGLTLSMATFWLCAWRNNDQTLDSTPGTIGVFSTVTGALVAACGTFHYSDFSFTGAAAWSTVIPVTVSCPNIAVLASQMIGVTFSDSNSNHAVGVTTPDSFSTTTLAHGGVVDCFGSPVSCSTSQGSALAGSFTLNSAGSSSSYFSQNPWIKNIALIFMVGAVLIFTISQRKTAGMLGFIIAVVAIAFLVGFLQVAVNI
jgi:hypothetical protein